MESCCYYQYLSISINYYHNIFKYHPNIIQISKSSRGQSQDPWNWPELDGTGWTFAPVVIHFLRLVRTLLNAVISAQEKGSTWLRAVTLTMQMRRVFGCQPNVVSFNAASSACEKAYRWTSSIQLFDWAKERSIEVDTISGNALLAACRGARRWCEVLQLLEVFFVSNLFLDDLALRMALEVQLERGDRGDRGPAPVTMELLGSMDHLWINILSRNVSKSWQGIS